MLDFFEKFENYGEFWKITNYNFQCRRQILTLGGVYCEIFLFVHFNTSWLASHFKCSPEEGIRPQLETQEGQRARANSRKSLDFREKHMWPPPGQKSVWRSLLCFVQVQACRPSLCPFWNQLKEQLWVGQGEFFVRMFYVPLFVRIINVEYMSAWQR